MLGQRKVDNIGTIASMMLHDFQVVLLKASGNTTFTASYLQPQLPISGQQREGMLT